MHETRGAFGERQPSALSEKSSRMHMAGGNKISEVRKAWRSSLCVESRALKQFDEEQCRIVHIYGRGGAEFEEQSHR